MTSYSYVDCFYYPEINGYLPFVEESEERACRLLERALSCEAVKELYDKASQTSFNGMIGNYKVEFVEGLEFPAQTILFERVIKINSNLSDDYALSTIVFELTNAVAAPKFEKLLHDACEGSITCEAYAKECERIEFFGCLLHHKIIQEVIDKLHLVPKADIYSGNSLMSFERYWEGIKYSAHTEFYRNVYNKARLCSMIPLVVAFTAVVLALCLVVILKEKSQKNTHLDVD